MGGRNELISENSKYTLSDLVLEFPIQKLQDRAQASLWFEKAALVILSWPAEAENHRPRVPRRSCPSQPMRNSHRAATWGPSTTVASTLMCTPSFWLFYCTSSHRWEVEMDEAPKC